MSQVQNSKDFCVVRFYKNKIPDTFIYHEMSPPVGKYLQKRGAEPIVANYDETDRNLA